MVSLKIFGVFLLLVGVLDLVRSAAVTCGSCTVADDTKTTCDATSASIAYCIYKTGTDCTDATKKAAIIVALKKQTSCTSLTKTCQCQKTYLEAATQDCTAKKTLQTCVYKETDAGCGASSETNAQATQWISTMMNSDATCTGTLTGTCKCQNIYFALTITTTNKCTSAKAYKTCVVARDSTSTELACDGVTQQSKVKTDVTTLEGTACGAAGLTFSIVGSLALMLVGFLIKN